MENRKTKNKGKRESASGKLLLSLGPFLFFLLLREKTLDKRKNKFTPSLRYVRRHFLEVEVSRLALRLADGQAWALSANRRVTSLNHLQASGAKRSHSLPSLWPFPTANHQLCEFPFSIQSWWWVLGSCGRLFISSNNPEILQARALRFFFPIERLSSKISGWRNGKDAEASLFFFGFLEPGVQKITEKQRTPGACALENHFLFPGVLISGSRKEKEQRATVGEHQLKDKPTVGLWLSLFRSFSFL